LDFEPEAVSRMTAADIDRIMQDPGVVRHRGKLESVVSNAKLVLQVQEESGSLCAHLWRFAPADRAPLAHGAMPPAVSPES
ncbi:DNA-3-methyladenine glycosylase I, partial [Salmonella enterica]|uniref:DNA-3-methyladenine glycosylase I n=1 Tax=Salmonella enterica TaxID=28901 RepID=UPI003299C870